MPSSNFTRCPECTTVFRVTEQQLQLARGKVRCGACLTVFFAPDYFVQPKSSQPKSSQPKPVASKAAITAQHSAKPTSLSSNLSSASKSYNLSSSTDASKTTQAKEVQFNEAFDGAKPNEQTSSPPVNKAQQHNESLDSNYSTQEHHDDPFFDDDLQAFDAEVDNGLDQDDEAEPAQQSNDRKEQHDAFSIDDDETWPSDFDAHEKPLDRMPIESDIFEDDALENPTDSAPKPDKPSRNVTQKDNPSAPKRSNMKAHTPAPLVSSSSGMSDKELADINRYLAKELDGETRTKQTPEEGYDPNRESLDNLSLGDVEIDDLNVDDFDLDEDVIERFIQEGELEPKLKQGSSEATLDGDTSVPVDDDFSSDIDPWDVDDSVTAPSISNNEDKSPDDEIDDSSLNFDKIQDDTNTTEQWAESEMDRFEQHDDDQNQNLAFEPFDDQSLEPDPLDEFDDFVEEESHRWKWLSATLVVVVGLLWGGYTLWTERQILAWDSTWGGLVHALCALAPCALDPQRDVSAIELIQRDIRPSEQDPDRLEFNLLIKNNAAFDQPFPTIAITFTDTEGRPVAQESHPPSSYLNPELKLDKMTKGQTIQILVIANSTYPNAPGFQFDFQ